MSGGRPTPTAETSGQPSHPAPILRVDADGTVTELPPGGHRVFPTEADDLVGQTVADLESDGLVPDGTTERYEAIAEAVGKNESADTGDGNQSDAAEDGGSTAAFRTAIGTGDDHPEYAISLHPDGDEYVWQAAETGPAGGEACLLEQIREATTAIASQETIRGAYASLENQINDILGPTGIDVRRIEGTELIRVTKGNGRATVDERTVVDPTEEPYCEVWPDGDTVRASAEFADGYETALIVPIGSKGTICIGRVGGELRTAERDIVRQLAAQTATTIEKIDYRTRLNDQHGSLDRYETLVASMPTPVYWTDASGRITFVNRAFSDEFDYPEETCRGQGIEQFVTKASAEAIQEAILELLEPDTGEYTQVSITGVRPDGREFELDASIGVVYHDGEYDGVVGVLRNVTERKREEQIATVMNRALRHNLRTSINNIIGYAELAEEGIGNTDEHMQVIREEGEWLMKLGDRLRAVRRSIADSSHSLAMPIEELLDPIVAEYHNQHPEAAIHTDYDRGLLVHGGAPLQVAVDNVIENAIVHNDSDNPTVHIAVSGADTGDWLTIEVSDSGPGIPERDVELVLGDTEITQLQHGTGIGLWITRWIVEIFDGELDITTGDDGTTVSIRLQRARQ